MPAKLVIIGDSLSSGFMSFATTRVDLSYGAILADCLDMKPGDWRVPDFHGAGGFPFSLEWMARKLQAAYGDDLTGFEWVGSLIRVNQLLDEVEDYWERGPGSRPVDDLLPYHNLAVEGFRVADAYAITDQACYEQVKNSTDNFLGAPSEDVKRTAVRVLNPSLNFEGFPQTQITRAQQIARLEDGIENLIVWLGANNALATVLTLKVKETDDAPPDPLTPTDRNLWSAKAFEADYRRLAEQVKTIGAGRVIVATLPHIVIPPFTRGINADLEPLQQPERYFDYYTYFWIDESKFDPARDPRLVKAEAIKIDSRIDEYNLIIKQVAAENGWCVADICAALDRAAIRRNWGAPTYDFPPEMADLNVGLFQIDRDGRRLNGGLFSLDAIHPSHCGYTLIAHEFRQAMIQHYNLPLKPINFAAERLKDTMVSNPPRTLDDLIGAVRTLESTFHLTRFLHPLFIG